MFITHGMKYTTPRQVFRCILPRQRSGLFIRKERCGLRGRTNLLKKRKQKRLPIKERGGVFFIAFCKTVVSRQLSVGSGQQVQSIKTKTFRCFVLAFVLCFFFPLST